jgi:hypothetical protein
MPGKGGFLLLLLFLFLAEKSFLFKDWKRGHSKECVKIDAIID